MRVTLRCLPQRTWTFLLCLAALLASHAAAAQSISELADRLLNSPDSRVRVQAALALGTSKSKLALGPLCGGLNDSEPTVRCAAVAGLGRLGRVEALPCLRQRRGGERNSFVRSSIERAMSRLERIQP